MLALASTNRMIRRAPDEDGSAGRAFLRNGRAKPSASRQMTAQRKISSRICSRRLRRVRRGGEGDRNMSELNGVRSRVVRRMRWKITGSATARAPRRKNGARKLIWWSADADQL